MTRRHSVLLAAVFCVLFPAHGFAAADQTAALARVRADVARDLDPARPPESLAGRTCLDGRPAADFPGDVVEYWADLECPYCGIVEPMRAQRQNPGVCVVVRHSPKQYGESMKKALSYEALKKFSVNGALTFWDAVVPKTPQEIPPPYEASLLRAFHEAAIDPEAFGQTLGNEASSVVNQDIIAAQGRISATPTWVLAGIRFSGCDFTAEQFPMALELAKKARAGDKEALEHVIALIAKGLMNQPMQ